MLEYLKRPWFLIGLSVLIAGLDISVLLTKLPRLVGLIFIAAGALLIYLDLRNARKAAVEGEPAQKRVQRAAPTKPRLSQRIVKMVSLDGRLLPYFWLFGVAVIAIDVAINLLLISQRQNSDFGSFDLIVIAFGATLILYRPLTARYPRETDFLMVFFMLLIIILIIPLWIVKILSGNTDDLTSQQDIVYVLLTAPLSGILSVLGITNSAQGLFIYFTAASGDHLGIGIAASCAGIYSFGIFLSAFLAFVLSEFTKFSRRIAVLLAVGVLFTYFANLLRMTIVVLAGYYNGMGVQGDPAPFTLLWTHAYAGEIIFICWVALFWWIAFRYFAPVESESGEIVSEKGADATATPAPKDEDPLHADDAGDLQSPDTTEVQ